MSSVFEMYAEHNDGWEYLGNCPKDSIMWMAVHHRTDSDTRLMFLDSQVILSQMPSYNSMVKKLQNFVLDNVEHLLIQSMFDGYPDLIILPAKEVLDGFKPNGLELTGYTRTSAAS